MNDLDMIVEKAVEALPTLAPEDEQETRKEIRRACERYAEPLTNAARLLIEQWDKVGGAVNPKRVDALRSALTGTGEKEGKTLPCCPFCKGKGCDFCQIKGETK